MSAHTIAARLAAALVALVAGAASFSHIADVAMAAGERAWVAYSLPVAIDGLIVVGVAALLEDRRAGLRPRPVARVAVLVGVVATLAANVASAQPTWTGRLVAVAAPVAFLLSVEVLTRSGRRAARVAAPVAMPEVPEVSVVPEPVEATREPEPVAVPEVPERSGHGRTRRGGAAGKVAAALAARPNASVTELAKLAGVSRSTVRRNWPETVPAT
ncbi:hypothetical protein ML5_1392 [Micromonospora sp. L5]|uniref:DUF2637 domain-containing protein n=1 Tax=Micromonospora sp. (strain L5) TaxID=648999 RepID=UPI0001C465CC|nr:DUF2637 domain-containing protein [Micromonospora sp. L5]ADU06930.1 hypothetical protein ML5_1392 [Micromonospora sp. L5]